MKKKKKLADNDKIYAQREHAKRRLLERYGLEINREQYQVLCDYIKHNNAIHIKDQSWRRQIWIIRYSGQWLPVSYDRQRRQISSFLPKESIIFDDNGYPRECVVKEDLCPLD